MFKVGQKIIVSKGNGKVIGTVLSVESNYICNVDWDDYGPLRLHMEVSLENTFRVASSLEVALWEDKK